MYSKNICHFIKKYFHFSFTYELAHDGGGEEVPVSDTGHGLDGPPHGLGDAGVLGVRHVLLREVGEGSEYQHAHAHEQQQQAQLLVTRLHGVRYGLCIGRILA